MIYFLIALIAQLIILKVKVKVKVNVDLYSALS